MASGREGSSVRKAAKSLGVDEGSIRDRVRRFAPPVAPSSPDASPEELRRELLRLREENRRLLMEREILKSDVLLREGAPVKFAFIRDHRAESPVEVLCQILKVSRGGYYAWSRRPAEPGGTAP